jgi:hypothetical protein
MRRTSGPSELARDPSEGTGDDGGSGDGSGDDDMGRRGSGLGDDGGSGDGSGDDDMGRRGSGSGDDAGDDMTPVRKWEATPPGGRCAGPG